MLPILYTQFSDFLEVKDPAQIPINEIAMDLFPLLAGLAKTDYSLSSAEGMNGLPSPLRRSIATHSLEGEG